MISKDIEAFPENSERLTGTIDIWWIVRILAVSMHLSMQEDFAFETYGNTGIVFDGM